MTFCSPFAVTEFDVPPTASHKNNFAKLVRANAHITVPKLIEIWQWLNLKFASHRRCVKLSLRSIWRGADMHFGDKP